jgi:hypothetical protein
MIRVERAEAERVVLSRAFLDDPRLSLRAKGLLAYLLSREAGELAVEALVAGGERTSDVESSLRELERAGYFARSSAPDAPAEGVVHETSARPLLAPPPRPARESERGTRAEADQARAEGEAAARILARLNELRASHWTWAKYTPLSAKHKKNVEHVYGRLREGYSERDLILVLEYLAAVDGGKDASRRYFDSVTPFNTKNFERNLALARDWEARGRPAEGGLLAQRADGHDPAIYERRVKGGGA